MKVEAVSVVRPLTPGMRSILLLASVLVFVAGFQLFILTEETARFFAWTVNPPLSAAFLGASYWSSCVLEYFAAREQSWARARIAVPAVLLFTTLTLITTLLHIGNFHLDVNSYPLYTVAAAWVWIAIYALVPLMMGILLVVQLRAPGSDPPRRYPLPSWMRGLVALQAVVMVLLGAALFLWPTQAIAFWSWMTGALSARAVGAWLLGLGIAAGQVVWENDLARVYPVMISTMVFSILQGIALLRYPGNFLWGTPQAWGYLVFLLSILVVGVAGTVQARRVKDSL